ncbi:MAG TPA: hypothetical protein VE546_12110 [Streptomyces sp.]|uniref:hypothetical protein n=1 Tax=Streptomyces sp. TaxID=1931 RepID=UPI002D75F4C3|nr:hypothetical protein [Streptomyces sp.]HZG04299.1 hypothetical protein [Streptomyces sp.]
MPILKKLDLPPRPSAARVCQLVEEQRKRPLYVRPLPLRTTAGTCGVWLATDTADFVFHEVNTTRPHQDHIILHEVGHLLFQHHGLDLPGTRLLADALPDLDPRLVRRLLQRTAYTTEQELEAEMFASLVLGHAPRPRPSGQGRAFALLEESFGLSAARG